MILRPERCKNMSNARKLMSEGGQNHVLCYFIRNMGFKWPILHQSWVHINYDGLENNLNDSHVNKAWFWHWHQKGAKICQMQENWYLRGSKLPFMQFYQKYAIKMANIVVLQELS